MRLYALCAALLLHWAQAQTITDDLGDVVAVTVDDDDVTSTLSTISIAAPSIVGVPAVGDATSDTCTAATCPAPASASLFSLMTTGPIGASATYASYGTVNGEQVTYWLTFVATTPATPPAATVPAGTIMDASAYLASIGSRAAASDAANSSSPPSLHLPTLPILAATGVCALAGLAILL